MNPEHITTDEIKQLLAEIVPLDEFLYACSKDDSVNLEAEVFRELHKYKVDSCTYSFSGEEFISCLDIIKSFYVSQTLLRLAEKGVFEMSMNKQGDLVLQPTKVGKEIIQIMEAEKAIPAQTKKKGRKNAKKGKK